MAKRRKTRRTRRERPGAKPTTQAGGASSKYFLPVLLFLICFGAYVSNGDFLPGGDQEGNMLLSVNILKRNAFSLSPPDAPGAFFWRLEQPGEKPRGVTFNVWNREVSGLYEKGQLKARGAYYLAQTTRPDVYVNAFGIGSAIVGLPVYAVLDLFVDTAPFFALLIVPVIERVFANRRMRMLFGALLIWSITVQFIGAYSYSVAGWTEQWWNEKRDNNPDKDSLWQWTRPQIAYHIANFKSERALKKRLMQVYTKREIPILYLSPRK